MRFWKLGTKYNEGDEYHFEEYSDFWAQSLIDFVEFQNTGVEEEFGAGEQHTTNRDDPIRIRDVQKYETQCQKQHGHQVQPIHQVSTVFFQSVAKSTRDDNKL